MKLEDWLIENRYRYKKELPLSSLTGMNLSGTLPFVVLPSSVSQLRILFQYVIQHGLTYEIIGNLTNTYICEGICRDVIIQTINVRDIAYSENEVEVGCGYNLTRLARELSKKGVTGYEGFVGIPGTVGAAAINNSGAFGDEMSYVIKSIKILNDYGVEETLTRDQLHYSPRNSTLKGNYFGVLLSVTMKYPGVRLQEQIDDKIRSNEFARKRDIDGSRKSLGSIIAGYSVNEIWKAHPISNIIRKLIFVPFKRTKFKKKAQCISEFISLGNIHLIKHCDNIGRFCWSKTTKEKDFMGYIDFIKKKSDRIILEIDIKR